MDSLKECLNIVIRSLPPATTLFNLIGFGSSYKILFTDERTPPAPTSPPTSGTRQMRAMTTTHACMCVSVQMAGRRGRRSTRRRSTR